MTSAHELPGRVSVTVHEADNVTTVLDTRCDENRLAGGGPVDAGVPFGHKVALVDIALNEPVIKYGVVIGHASVAIKQGQHVHVHNVR